jgi:hypothetical protein
LQHLRRALTGKDRDLIHNIALTGGYGVGKSSILQQLRKEFPDTAATSSLPTLGESVPLAREGAKEDPAGTSVTNRIQKEIVKQGSQVDRGLRRQLGVRGLDGLLEGSPWHRRRPPSFACRIPKLTVAARTASAYPESMAC